MIQWTGMSEDRHCDFRSVVHTCSSGLLAAPCSSVEDTRPRGRDATVTNSTSIPLCVVKVVSMDATKMTRDTFCTTIAHVI